MDGDASSLRLVVASLYQRDIWARSHCRTGSAQVAEESVLVRPFRQGDGFREAHVVCREHDYLVSSDATLIFLGLPPINVAWATPLSHLGKDMQQQEHLAKSQHEAISVVSPCPSESHLYTLVGSQTM